MKVGTLVRGEVNGCMGIVTDVIGSGHETHVRIYWLDLDLQSTTWIRTFDLEVLCK